MSGEKLPILGMRRLEEFRIFYNHTIHPELMRLSKRRKRLLLLLFLSLLFLTGALVLEAIAGIWFLTLMLMLPIGIYISYLGYRIQRFIGTFKPQVIRLILDFIDDSVNYGDLTYEPKGGLPKELFQQSMLFGTNADVYQAEDYIKGKIGSVSFELCELNVREFSRVRSRLNYVFKGIFLHARIEEAVYGKIAIFPGEFRQYLSRAIRRVVNQGGRSVDHLMKSEHFREHFITYAIPDIDEKTPLEKRMQSAVEAKMLEASVSNLLSVDMQNILANYREETDKEIYISFIGRDIFLAVTEHKNILEPYIFRSNISFELVREFYEDIAMLFEIVEDFDKIH
jgi:hypothetical protein